MANTLWNTVLKRLHADLGDEAYARWISDCAPDFLSFEDDIFTIRAARQSAHYHIGDRITKILDGMGFTGASVRILPTDETVIVAHDSIKDLYDEIVRPDRALSLPGYIQRWVEQEIGADGFFMVASLKQSSYEAGARGEGGLFTARFSAKQIAARAGISIRTYWNRLSDEAFWSKLKGLVVKHDDPKIWALDGGKPRQAARRFSVFTTIPLTPRDTAHLRQWLLENAEVYGGPEGALRAAVDTPVNELIGNGDGPADEAMTVLELVSSIFGDQLDPKLLSVLASNLHRHIVPPQDIFRISLFFLEYVLPALGPSLGYLLVLMRDRCFVNQEVSRTTVTFKGGWDEIAAKIGLTGERRAKTVWEWLNARYPASHEEAGKYRNAVARAYMAEVLKDGTELDFAHQPRTFRVLMDEIPRELLEAVVTNQDSEKILQSGFCTHGTADFSQSGFCTLGVAQFALTEDALCTHAMAQFALIFMKVAQLKALKLLNKLLSTNQPAPAAAVPDEPLDQPQPQAPASPAPEESRFQPQPQPQPQISVGRSGWNFSELVQTNNINPLKVAEMAAAVPDEQERAERFVGWVLYAHSPKGRGLKDDTGVGLAISNIGTRPGRAFLRLAQLGPQKLRALFDSDFARTLGHSSIPEEIYRANLKKLPLDRKQDLYYRLFAVDAPDPAAAAADMEGASAAKIGGADGGPKPAPFKVPRRAIRILE